MKPDYKICRQVNDIMRRHKVTAEALGKNYGNSAKKSIDGAKKMQVISEIRAAVGKQVTLDELAGYINVSPSKISFFTDYDILK